VEIYWGDLKNRNRRIRTFVIERFKFRYCWFSFNSH
jgi:hypothetical protein